MLKIKPYFCQSGMPYDEFEWETRTAEIPGASFRQENVEVPKAWSQTATNIVASKYFYGLKGDRETSVQQMVHRVIRTIADWGVEDGYFDSKNGEVFYHELCWLILDQRFAFNSPVWFNCGLAQQYGVEAASTNWYYDTRTSRIKQPQNAYEHPQLSACFIQSVEDNLESIMELGRREALLFKYGSGTGTNVSPLRSMRENLSGGGIPSGPLSFMRIYDQIAEVVTSGGRCLAGNQCVYTPEGPKEVRDLVNTDFKVISYTPWYKRNTPTCPTKKYFEAKKASAWESGKKDVVRITTDRGTFDVSFDHPCWTADLKVLKANRLKIGTRLFACESMNPNGYFPTYEYAEQIVLKIESLGLQPVYSIEVECDTPDTKTCDSGHNYVIWGSKDITGSGIVVSNTRRAALLRCINTDHPDIMEYITCKKDEDAKARVLIEHGLDPQVAYKTVMYQNANLSVRVSDEFMQAVINDKEWNTYWITNPETLGPVYKARDLWRAIAESAWACGDPGLQFDTMINNWFPCPYEGKNTSSNPCGEFLGHDNSACNLASLNLMKFFDSEAGKFNHKDFQAACRLATIAQEILVDRASYPTKEICKNAHRLRPIGLGYTNLGAVIMCSGNPYDSDEGRSLAASITALMHGTACLTSIEMAKVKEPFEAYDDNKSNMLSIIEIQADCACQLLGPKYLTQAIKDIWEQVTTEGVLHGFRNSQLTLSAPTGTISFLLDADTTGIEPDLSLIKNKQLVGGGTLRMVNQSVPKALKALGHSDTEIVGIIDYLDKNEELPDTVRNLQVFDTAIGKHPIAWLGHLKMLSAVQPFLSGGISKTVNLSAEATVEDIMDVYMTAWKMRLKSITIYRDNSKAYQPLTTGTDKIIDKAVYLAKTEGQGFRERLPDTRDSVTHKFNIGGHEGYFTVGLYPDGRPGELFIAVSKEGSTIGGLLDCFGIATSIGLQYGVPLDAFIVKFENTRFEPNGWTTNSEIRNAKSIIDYIFRWLALRFGSEALNNIPNPVSLAPEEEPDVMPKMDSPICTNCGALTVRVGACFLCYSCGTSGGCS